MVKFGERLKAARTAKHMSQQALADVIGKSLNTVGLYERGLRQPSRVALFAASTARDNDLPDLVQRYARLAELDPELADVAHGLRAQLPTTAPPSRSPSGPPKSAPATSRAWSRRPPAPARPR